MSSLLVGADNRPLARVTRDDDWLNSPSRWHENIPCPVSLKWLNGELLRIGGAEANGTPHYRAVWGQDLEASMVRDRYNDRFVPRYVFRVKSGVRMSKLPDSPLIIAVPEEKVIGTPRIYIEAFLPPEVVCRSGNLAGVDGDGDRYSEWWPREGDWMPMIEICEHDEYKTCCKTAHENDQNCHGYFRAPDQRDVETMEGLWQAWQRMRSVGPTDAPDRDLANDAMRYAIEREKARHAAMMEEVSYNTKSFFRTHAPQLSDDPSVQANGKFHFLKG